MARTIAASDVYIHAAAAGSTAWRQLAHYQLEVGFWDAHDGRPQSFLTGDSLLTTIPGRKMAHLDLSTGQSETRSLPGGVSSFAVSADGVLRCVCVATIAENPYESNDL